MSAPDFMEETTANENQARPKAFLVGVYLVDRAYGGPEEGGWWYDCGELVRVIRLFKNQSRAEDFARALNSKLHATLNRGRRPVDSVLSDGCYSARVFPNSAPRFFPETRPFYE